MLPVSSLIKVPVPYIWSKPQIPKLFILLKLNEESSNLIKGKRQRPRSKGSVGAVRVSLIFPRNSP